MESGKGSGMTVGHQVIVSCLALLRVVQ